jgi:hypothetical protein
MTIPSSDLLHIFHTSKETADKKKSACKGGYNKQKKEHG